MRRPYSLACLEFARSVAKAAMSAPAAKAFSPAPRTTTQRSDSSALRVRAISPSCSHMGRDRKSTRLNSSHLVISYAVFCLKKKKKTTQTKKRRSHENTYELCETIV